MNYRGPFNYLEFLDAAEIKIEPHLKQFEFCTLSLQTLTSGTSPRADGLDSAHVERLVEAEWPLAPIVVHLPGMEVIDGHHRLAAARAKGMDAIDAYLYRGSADSAFMLSVRANVTHGLPLALSDRRAAAIKILGMHSDWSDRAIGKSTGLSAKAVSRLRCVIDSGDQIDARVGRDGRWRRLDTSAARRRAAELLKEAPDASLREVARAVGLSPGTVRDVRLRLARGESPAPDSGLAVRPDIESDRFATDSVVEIDRPKHEAAEYLSLMELPDLLNALSRNPALRMSDSGRELLRWLHTHAINDGDSERILESTPDHCVKHLLAFARESALRWSGIANDLTERLERIDVTSSITNAS